jgi:hypothetical protein
MDLLHRFEYFEASPRCADELTKKIDEFYNKLSTLPQCCKANGGDKK